jgi:hypothetical protein
LYSISLYDFSPKLYLYPKDNRAYTTLNKKQVDSFIGWFKEIGY